jgi:hypothetical protein
MNLDFEMKIFGSVRVCRQFIMHNSPLTIHRGTIHHRHNSSPAQFTTAHSTAALFTAVTIHCE